MRAKTPNSRADPGIRLVGDEIFSVAARDSDLAGKTARGGVVTLGSQGIKFFLNMARTMILARLLMPSDFGLISMVAVIIGFAGMFKDAGLSMATVQKKEITHDQISSLFWINVIISLVLGLCIVALSPLVSLFYGRPELTVVTMALAVPFIVSGFTIQHTALLRRHMRFIALAIEQALATMIGLATAVILALRGLGYWALVGDTIAISVTMLVLTFFMCPWLPGRMKRGVGARDMLSFGGYLTGSNIMGYLSRNADNMLIGKFIGAGELGLYDKAYHLFRMPIDQIRTPLNSVAMPALSALQGNPERFVRYYRALLRVIATLAMPLTVYCAIEAGFVIRLILGEQWLAVVPVFRVLAVAGFVEVVAGSCGIVMTSCGFAKRYFKWGLVVSSFTIVAFAAGLPFGIFGVATAFVIARLLLLFPTLVFSFRYTPVKPLDFFVSIYMPFLYSLLAGLLICLLSWFWKPGGGLVSVFHALVFWCVYAGLAFSSSSFREIIKLFFKRSPAPSDRKAAIIQ